MILRPKQRAEDLINKMYYIANYSDNKNYISKIHWLRAIECALVAAKECQKEMNDIGHYDFYYWEEVIIELTMIKKTKKYEVIIRRSPSN